MNKINIEKLRILVKELNELPQKTKDTVIETKDTVIEPQNFCAHVSLLFCLPSIKKEQEALDRLFDCVERSTVVAKYLFDKKSMVGLTGSLARWAHANPEIWGNDEGVNMFELMGSAFSQRGISVFCNETIVVWWTAVLERCETKQRREDNDQTSFVIK
jgi:hypothetical protein